MHLHFCMSDIFVNSLKINSRWLPGLILGVIGVEEIYDLLE
mgnify:CR=1 FL=1